LNGDNGLVLVKTHTTVETLGGKGQSAAARSEKKDQPKLPKLRGISVTLAASKSESSVDVTPLYTFPSVLFDEAALLESGAPEQ